MLVSYAQAFQVRTASKTASCIISHACICMYPCATVKVMDTELMLISSLRTRTISIMLRVFRLDPAFELEVNPINVMYIDIQSEDEIKEKYITNKQLPEGEFDESIEHQTNELYMGNYLVLQPKGSHNIPSLSDIDIVKSIPGASLPHSYTLSLDDLEASNPLKSEALVNISQVIEATRPSEFIISIRSEYSNSEKLTTDQNEALCCSMAYYYPVPPPRTMVTGTNSGIFPHESLPDQSNRDLASKLTLYKRELFSLYTLRDLDPLKAPKYLYPRLEGGERMYFMRYSDSNIKMVPAKTNIHDNKITMGFYDLPPPLHSVLLATNLFHSRRAVRTQGPGLVMHVVRSFSRLEPLIPDNAFVPFRNALRSCSVRLEELEDSEDSEDSENSENSEGSEDSEGSSNSEGSSDSEGPSN